jgi:hypothetical protein
MGWGDPSVTRRRIQPDTSIPYSTGNATLSLQHVGMLKRIMFRLNAAYGYTKSAGPSVRDALGPWNIVNNLNVKVNAVGTFLDASMWHLYLYNLVHYAGTNFDPQSSENTGIQNTVLTTDVFNNPAVPGATGPITPVLAQLSVNIGWGILLTSALSFVGALRDPVRNRWLFDFGLIACVLVIPYALVFGALRQQACGRCAIASPETGCTFDRDFVTR